MKRVIAYVHSHWDREWYREFEEFRLRLIEVFDEILYALETGDLPYFYFDGQTAALEDYLEIFPNKKDRIKKLVEQKKLRIGPFYCSADSFLVSGECLYRNFEMGINKSKEFGETDFIGYLSDTFGHSSAVPYILKAFNIKNACMWRGLGDLPADLNWLGINATYLIQGYFQDFLSAKLPIEKKAELLKNYLDKISAKSSSYVLLPIGADHLAMPKNIKEQIDALNKIYADYEIELKTPFEYFEKIKKREKVEGEFLNNTKNFILSGVYSSRIYIKQANAKSQWLLTNIAEPLQALGHFYFKTKNKQAEIDYAYKTLIQNHAHDSIYGCSIDKVHREMLPRFEKVDSISNGIIKRTLRDLSQDTKNLAVINLGNSEYSGKIKITTNKKLPKWMKAVKVASKKGFTDEKLYNINEIPVTEDFTNINEYIIDVKDLKPFSITQITKENICDEENIRTGTSSIENNNIKLEVKNGKIILTDKKNNLKYSDFITITDRKDIGDSYNFGALKGDKPIKAVLSSFKLTEKNSQRAILKLVYDIKLPASHKLYIDVILYNQAQHLEFSVKWINKSKNHILQIGFNLKDKITQTISEDLYGTVKRNFDPDFDIYKLLPVKSRGIELKPNTAPMQRFVATQNFGLITIGNCEYEINKNTLNLTLLRATGTISNKDNPTRTTPAGPPLETPDLQCLGENSANFAICFTKKEDDLFSLADHFYGQTATLFTDIENQEFLNISNKNIRLTSMQNTQDGLNLRFFNMSDKKEKTQIISSSKTLYSFAAKEIKNILIS